MQSRRASLWVLTLDELVLEPQAGQSEESCEDSEEQLEEGAEIHWCRGRRVTNGRRGKTLTRSQVPNEHDTCNPRSAPQL